MSKRILITGANGQLGRCLQDEALKNKYAHLDFFFADRKLLDISKKEVVETFFFSNQFNYVINCAAYTAVDKAEIEAEDAFVINSDASGWLAHESKEQNATFIHISTDYVFDGNSSEPYVENDLVNPQNVYGKSKLEGEKKAMKHNPDSIIIRTAWVYSEYGKNFYNTMKRLMSEKDELNIVSDQIGSPTNAHDLAAAILDIVVSGQKSPGIYHYSNEGKISWFNFAEAIKEKYQFTTKLNPISTSEYPTPAKRPLYSLLDKTKITETFDVKTPDWKESLFNR